MPASRQRSRVASRQSAVTAMIGTAAAWPAAVRIRRVASQPSSFGMWMSISTRSMPPRGTASSAASPSATAVTR